MQFVDITNSVSLAVTTAVLYEYGLTFERETQQYWSRRLDIPGALFFANRYLCLLSRFVVLIAVFVRPSPASGLFATAVHRIGDVLRNIYSHRPYGHYRGRAVLSAARVYALWHGNIWPSLSVFVFGLVLPSFSLGIGEGIFTSLTTARFISIVPDLLVVVFTWIKTRRLIASARVAGFAATLPKALRRGGIFYFALAAIIMSRFMLSLREVMHSKQHLVQVTRTDYDSIMGTLGDWMEEDSDCDVDELEFETAGEVQLSTLSTFQSRNSDQAQQVRGSFSLVPCSHENGSIRKCSTAHWPLECASPIPQCRMDDALHLHDGVMMCCSTAVGAAVHVMIMMRHTCQSLFKALHQPSDLDDGIKMATKKSDTQVLIVRRAPSLQKVASQETQGC
ncbi:hypothetical protein DAEQUDRAFT_738314 [Daedalea quercina L-15889]|uniref:DUF6533 domain-containing protein n=1 Tax=Daedalea quercina L-15889 TaxID=1314783 RepID=A0A165QAF9_9APHY|nr:hypothetical protein DAEQUDRAFT_738314 [Daedalea quercina L-15889]